MALSLSEELHLFSQELQRFLSPVVLQDIDLGAWHPETIHHIDYHFRKSFSLMLINIQEPAPASIDINKIIIQLFLGKLSLVRPKADELF